MAADAFQQFSDIRVEPRDEVMHRTRIALADQRTFTVMVVNVSPHGLMIRSDAPVSAGEWIRIVLPVVGEVRAAVRWALGGRLGCELGRAIPAAEYLGLLGAMQR